MIEKDLSKVAEELDAFTIASDDDLEKFRLQYISSKSVFSEFFVRFKDLSNEEKKKVGVRINSIKEKAQKKFKDYIKNKAVPVRKEDSLDYTLPPVDFQNGSIHPIKKVIYTIVDIFERMGYNVEEGPEIEDDWHNFSALNFPKNHPARQMQDTFFLDSNKNWMLRTHTSNVQIRLMSKEKPPFKCIMPGRVYRNEAISARSHAFFHQIEGLYIDTKVNFIDLKTTIQSFVNEFFGVDTSIRLRPSYFPFTEPSIEVDVSCIICGGEGCKICKHTGWLEIAGAGMVNPKVLENTQINPDEYSGFAFGIGIERLAMHKYQLTDIRLFSENDIRFLRQF